LISKDFYRKQNSWSHIYFRTPDETELQRVAFLNSIQTANGRSLLELGCGGQFALAAANAGYQVTAVDLEPEFIAFARSQSAALPESRLKYLSADFMEIEFDSHFDLICYWDGFGISEDGDQKRLLQKMTSWLKPGGFIILEIYAPLFWGKVACGKSLQVGSATRQYDFDAFGSRLLDQWWKTEKPETRVTQSLRCYTPADLKLLLEESGCSIKKIQPGGTVDFQTGSYSPQAALIDAMSYIAVIGKS
jgi:SAM-dependent methyltransferase